MQNTTLFKTLFRKLFTPCMNILKKHVLNFCMCGGELLLQKKKRVVIWSPSAKERGGHTATSILVSGGHAATTRS